MKKNESKKVSLNVKTTVADSHYDIIWQVFADANEYFTDAGIIQDENIEEWLEYQGPCGKELTISESSRLTRTVGYCQNSFDGIEIKLQSKLLDWKYYDDLKSVFFHELIHMLYPQDGHRGKFKECANILNQYDPSLKISTLYDHTQHLYQPQKKEHKEYVLRCKGCGLEFHYQRKTDRVKNYQHYHCAHCKGEIERIK